MKTFRFYLTMLVGMLLLNSCQDKQLIEELQMFKDIETLEQENIEVVKQFYTYLDEQKLDDLDGLLSSNHAIFYQSSKEPATLDDMKPLIEMFYTSFPDYTHNLGNTIAEGNMVSIRMSYTATHKNKFMEIEPTQNIIDYAGIAVFELSDGKIDNMWIVEDELTMMKQLGLELK